MKKIIFFSLMSLVFFLPMNCISQNTEKVFTIGGKRVICKGFIQENLMPFGGTEYVGTEFTIKFDSQDFFYGALDICTIKKEKESLQVTKYKKFPYLSMSDEYAWLAVYTDTYFYDNQKLLRKRVCNQKLRTLDKSILDKMVSRFENKYIHKREKVDNTRVNKDIQELFLISLNSEKYGRYLLDFEDFLKLDGEYLETLKEYQELYKGYVQTPSCMSSLEQKTSK